MNNKSITPSFPQPVDRIATGQLPSALAELNEAALAGSDVMPALVGMCGGGLCSFDGDE
jgi:bacteriocin leader peptide (microcyclamide/patellamide family)